MSSYRITTKNKPNTSRGAERFGNSSNQPSGHVFSSPSGALGERPAPLSSCGHTVRLLQVKKEGQNQGKFFYSCGCTGGGRGQKSAFVWKEEWDNGSIEGDTIPCKAPTESLSTLNDDGYALHALETRVADLERQVYQLQLLRAKKNFDKCCEDPQ